MRTWGDSSTPSPQGAVISPWLANIYLRRGKAAGGADMVLGGAVEAFDELLEGALELGDRLEVFPAENCPERERGLRG